MKKHLFFLCALAAVAVACNVEESGQSADRIVTVTATFESLPDSKSYYEDDGTFTWSESDEIAVHTTVNRFYRFTIVSIDEESDGIIASFVGTVNGSTTGVAVYPYIAGNLPTYDGESMTVTLPESYAWVERIAYNPMVSVREEETSAEEDSLAFTFKNIGALFKITLNDVPATATHVVFSTGKQITDTFAVNNLKDEDTMANISAGVETEDDGVTFTFTELQESANMVFYIPVPTGTYPYIAFEVKNTNDETLWGFRGQREQEMPRNKIMIMQPLTYPEGDTEKDVPPADYVEE